MSLVRVLNVDVVKPQAPFLEPYKFEITFECISPLEDDLEFKLVYVSSPSTSKFDQELDSLLVGPVPVAISKFVFEAKAPVPSKIPKEDMVGVSIILLTCSYKGKMFERIGYYVNNSYLDEALQADPPAAPVPEKLLRSILADKPRVTRYGINWEDPSKEEQPPAELIGGDGTEGDILFVTGPGGVKTTEVDGEPEDDEEGSEEDESSDDENGDVDLDATEEKDEAELVSEGENMSETEPMGANDGIGGRHNEDEGHGDTAMTIDKNPPNPPKSDLLHQDAVANTDLMSMDIE
ncbi:Histone chaperone asf1 [Coemansia javaensis]|uniref:Anti-silencing function protein 1 n=1 Tax=Coemansia javaensis TaxID=2761396 RepID=A0A9W8LIX8_9FUNG|nr:Histone chaperone asf1 [Coemansia javaensis]